MDIRISKDGTEIVLDQLDVEKIVGEWYTNGMMPEILLSDGGLELDELLIDAYNSDFEYETINED